ncbi:MAG: GHKL domain-containing protein [Defluviitaleaceae bacterium]|nr:GHKL domain-containing protein [Defluviitaleaceae bacterium]
MDIIMMLAVMGFFLFMALCSESMLLLSVKNKKREFVVSIIIGFIYGVCTQFMPVEMIGYATVGMFLLLNIIIYKKIKVALLSTVYALPLLFAFFTLTVLQLKVLGREPSIYDSFGAVLFVGNIAILLGATFLIKRFLKKRIDMNIFNNRIIHFLMINAGVALVLMYMYSGADNVLYRIFPEGTNPAYFAFLAFFVSTAFTFALILRYISRENTLNAEAQIHEASRQYVGALEESYRSLRAVKHDYVNILTSLKLHIDSGDMEGLKKYYYDELAEINKYMLNESRLTDDLQNIRPSEVKSIIAYKCAEAAGKGINVHIEAREAVEAFGVSTAVVCRLLGILLDNAIEGAVETADETITNTSAEIAEPSLSVAVFTNPKSKTFIVKNTWLKKDLPLSKIFDLGYSTKGEGRGIGLHTLRQYTSKLKGLTLSTETDDGHFTQILTAEDET